MKNINLYNYMLSFDLKKYCMITLLALCSIGYSHPHSKYELRSNPHTHPKYGDDLMYDLDNFDDIHFNSTKSPKSSYNSKNSANDAQQLILFDENLYLLDDDFDFGNDEFELKQLKLNANDLDTAKEYEDFLESFFNHSANIGGKAFQPDTENIPNNISKPKPKSKKTNHRPASPVMPQSSFFNLGYGISGILGATMPFGQNLTAQFSTGSNFGLRFDKPFSFNFMPLETKIGTDFYFSSMSPLYPGNTVYGSAYKLTNIAINVGISPINNLELRPGVCIAPSSIGGASKVLLGTTFEGSYLLPMDLSGFGFAVNMQAQLRNSIPTATAEYGATENATSAYLNFGLIIKTPYSL